MTRTTVFVAGVDEAGRGPLAGPVTAAAVVLPPTYRNDAIGDSKKLICSVREELYAEICSVALAYAIVSLGPREIETLNIWNATRRAMGKASEQVHRSLNRQFGTKPCPVRTYFLVDGNASMTTKLPHEPIIKGDDKLRCISAASILAKVARDRIMEQLDSKYPNYGFAEHKGYPTPFHREQLKQLGPCQVHRRTFAGVREFFGDALDTSLPVQLPAFS